jgi:DNA-binding transcriptional regulator GbsR (MarR family)
MASKTIETKFNDKIATEISEQHVSLRNLIKLLEEHSESKQPEFNEVLTKLKEINTMFENTAGYKAQPLEEGEEMPLSFQLTPQETNAIGAKVTELRNLVVN